LEIVDDLIAAGQPPLHVMLFRKIGVLAGKIEDCIDITKQLHRLLRRDLGLGLVILIDGICASLRPGAFLIGRGLRRLLVGLWARLSLRRGCRTWLLRHRPKRQHDTQDQQEKDSCTPSVAETIHASTILGNHRMNKKQTLYYFTPFSG